MLGVVMRTFAIALLPVALSAGVFDDAHFWCRGVVDKNANGLLDSGDFLDALHAGDGAYYGHKAYEYSPDNDAALRLKISSEEVIEPASCRSLGIHPCLKFTQPLYDNEGTPYSKQQCLIVSPAVKAEKPSDSAGWSFYLRIRPDGGLNLANDNDAQVVFNYFNSWQTGGGGVMLWLKGSPTSSYLSVQMGSTEKQLVGMRQKDYFGICTNKWTDVLVTKKDAKLNVYCIREGGRLYHESFTYDRAENAYMSNAILGSYDLLATPASYALRTWRNFRGLIHDFAVWKRALSEAEAMEIILPTGTDKFRLGTVNRSSLEFTGEGSQTVDADASNGWRSSPAAIAPGQSLSVRFNMKKVEYGLDETLFFTATPESAAGRLTLSVNGSAVGAVEVEPGRTVSCHVKKGLLAEGENFLTLANNSVAAIGVDCVAFGGSWQLLEADDSNDGGAGQKGLKDFSLNDTNLVENLKSILHAATKVSNTNLTFHFTVPADVIASAKRFRFSVRAWSETEKAWLDSKPEVTFRTLVNGVERGYLTYPKTGRGVPSLTIPVEWLSSGENTIRLESATPLWYDPEAAPSGRYCWIRIDYYRLEIMKDPTGMTIIFR